MLFWVLTVFMKKYGISDRINHKFWYSTIFSKGMVLKWIISVASVILKFYIQYNWAIIEYKMKGMSGSLLNLNVNHKSP